MHYSVHKLYARTLWMYNDAPSGSCAILRGGIQIYLIMIMSNQIYESLAFRIKINNLIFSYGKARTAATMR